MKKLRRLAPLLLTVAGIALSILSATDLCNFSGCTEAHLYRFFNLTFPMIGLGYFGVLGAALLLANWSKAADSASGLILAGGAGAEITMIHLQYSIIKAWCPLCLGLAAVVYLLCILKLTDFYIERRRSLAMKNRFVTKFLLLTAAAATGFLVSFTGISKPDAATTGGPDVSLGRQKSPVEVYFFSDWYCPMCVKVEPAIDAVYPTLLHKARVTFVDKAIHQEALNFAPYHISFATYEKEKYLELRKALFEVARKTKSPSLDDIKTAIAPLKVTYKQLSFMEVSQQMAKFQALATQYKVAATPTMVITNTKSNKTKTLVGGTEITGDNILKALKSVE